ncbi:MAG: thiamine phosphate synthase [Beijerinckiaceae bacterium]
MRLAAESLRLCLVTDRDLSRGRPTLDIVGAAVRGGATMVQLREKNATTRAFLEEARALKEFLAPFGVPLAINDRLDIALAVGADILHVGQSDMHVDDVRRIAGDRLAVGLSITCEADMLRADARAADYLGVGPVYAQQTKPDATPPLGIEGFRALMQHATKPVVAIGGLNAGNSAPVLAAGAAGLAVVSAIVAADDVEKAAMELADLWLADRR